ncbi:hypothetical protein ACWGII_18540 [Streptomyces sp. NPDC054855]
MTGLFEIWQRADVARRLDVLSGFVAMCVAGDDDARRRLSQMVADTDAPSPPRPRIWWSPRSVWTNSSAGLTRSGSITRIVPWKPRPDEADRQTRDYAKDLRHAALPARARGEMGRIELSLEVRFLALCRQPGLDCRVGQDIFYVAGRAAMALDLGPLEAAEREVQRMEQVGAMESRQSHW